ncbi:MAG TPA: RsmB/NOP family class I SAM-dependent RNA methyltransferase [Candidatus Bathyarchaeia archaeon]|nr:RsmB/NOP family class I SAM-dependent RNA methyltransferase [Candidatus Bathyarchaeia archaeon]
MSGKQFFVDRYSKLGWEYRPVELKQAIRINITNAKEADTVRRLESRGIELEPVSFVPHAHWVRKSAFSVGATSEYLIGHYSIQEAAAQIPATLFSDLKDKTVLDACAAPGGKTIQLADLMHNTGVIFALDVDKRRLTPLSNHLERCRVENTIVCHMDARHASQLKIKFDRILLDVPCSGNFATDKEWFTRRTIEDVKRNAALQRQILTEAEAILNDDGEIVYSTCSLEPEENELNIDWATEHLELQAEPVECYGETAPTSIFGKRVASTVASCKRIWPGQTQGFFVCKLKKRV